MCCPCLSGYKVQTTLSHCWVMYVKATPVTTGRVCVISQWRSGYSSSLIAKERESVCVVSDVATTILPGVTLKIKSTTVKHVLLVSQTINEHRNSQLCRARRCLLRNPENLLSVSKDNQNTAYMASCQLVSDQLQNVLLGINKYFWNVTSSLVFAWWKILDLVRGTPSLVTLPTEYSSGHNGQSTRIMGTIENVIVVIQTKNICTSMTTPTLQSQPVHWERRSLPIQDDSSLKPDARRCALK